MKITIAAKEPIGGCAFSDDQVREKIARALYPQASVVDIKIERESN